MKKLSLWVCLLGLVLAHAKSATAQVQTGRVQLGSVSAGQQAGVFLIDTASGCTWQLASNPDTKRLTFVEMDIENLHWSWGSGAQQQLSQRIDASTLPEDQKLILKQELNKTACGWTPVVLTPAPAPAPAKKK